MYNKLVKIIENFCVRRGKFFGEVFCHILFSEYILCKFYLCMALSNALYIDSRCLYRKQIRNTQFLS